MSSAPGPAKPPTRPAGPNTVLRRARSRRTVSWVTSPVAAIGSGAPYATAAAKALLAHTDLPAREIALRAMEIAADLCIFTNNRFTIEEVGGAETGEDGETDAADEQETE